MGIDKKGKKRKSSFLEESLKKDQLTTSTPLVQKGSSSQEISDESSSVSAVSQPSLDAAKLKSAVKAVLKLFEEHSSKGTSLFSDEAHPIQLQITCIKVAKTPERQIRLLLPHSLVTDTSDVCLFVCDLKKGKKEDHEPTIVHYQDLLERNGVKGITQVIPVRQLKVEYDQYELKRRLCDRFDYFLTDSKVSGHVRHLLGIHFVKRRKYPTPVKMDAKNLKSEITRNLSKTVLNLHGKGNSNSLTVAHSKQSPQQIVENIMAVATGLAQEYPGGWSNIRSLNLKGPRSLALPIYMTLKSSNILDVPCITSKKPKAAEPVEDELSTFLGARVKVLPSGKVVVTKVDGEGEDDSDTELNELMEEFKTVPKPKKGKRNKNKNKKKPKEKVISGPVMHRLSLSSGMDDGSLSVEEETETSPKHQAKKGHVNKAVEPEQMSKKKKKKKKVVASGEEDDDDDIQEAESAYLSEIFQERESSFNESETKSPGSFSPQKKKKGKLFDKVQKKHKLGVAKPKSFMKINKKHAASKVNRNKKQN